MFCPLVRNLAYSHSPHGGFSAQAGFVVWDASAKRGTHEGTASCARYQSRPQSHRFVWSAENETQFTKNRGALGTRMARYPKLHHLGCASNEREARERHAHKSAYHAMQAAPKLCFPALV